MGLSCFLTILTVPLQDRLNVELFDELHIGKRRDKNMLVIVNYIVCKSNSNISACEVNFI